MGNVTKKWWPIETWASILNFLIQINSSELFLKSWAMIISPFFDQDGGKGLTAHAYCVHLHFLAKMLLASVIMMMSIWDFGIPKSLK